tara:strand:- start:60 stop:980 length:921 start_codon:yes stop_codon:yes gene_type:complete
VKKKILVIIGGRGIGDLIYHLPLLKSLYKSYGKKIYIFSNKVNQAKQVFRNENFYEKIIEFDNYRLGLIKTILNIFNFKNKINNLKPDYVFLTSNTKRLVIPTLLSNIKNKYIFGTGNFFVDKDNSLNHLALSEKILKYTLDLKLPKKDNSFLLNKENFKKKLKTKKKQIFIVIDSHHDQNNWPTENFIQIIRKLLKKNKVYINFSPNKKYFLKFFPNKIKKSKNIEFTYKRKISEIIDIIYSCDVVIGNETGPICLGSALQKKVHALYAPLHTLPESKVINKKNKYYNTYLQNPEKIINKILNSI